MLSRGSILNVNEGSVLSINQHMLRFNKRVDIRGIKTAQVSIHHMLRFNES